jgi:hypothetical protein
VVRHLKDHQRSETTHSEPRFRVLLIEGRSEQLVVARAYSALR